MQQGNRHCTANIRNTRAHSSRRWRIRKLIGGSFHRSWSLWRFFCHASSSLIMVSCIRWGV